MPDNIHFYEPRIGHGLPHDAQGRLNLAPYSFFNAFN